MKKIKLQEIYKATAKILFEGKTKDGNPTMNILVPFCQSDEATSNSRTYPRALMNREINRVQKDIESGKFLGTSDHNAKLDNVSHIVNKAWLDKNGQGWMEAKIIPTDKGRNLMTIVREGGCIGVSTRGFGNVKDGIVADNFVLAGIDCVLDNAYEKGTFNKDNIFESANFNEENEPNEEEIEKQMKKLEKREREMVDTLKFLFERKKAEGYSKTWDEFFEENENRAREIHGLEIKEKDGDKQRLEELERTVPLEKVTPSDVFLESRMLGISAREYAEKHNAEIDRKVLIEDERLLRKMFVEAGCSPEEATKKVEEQRGKPRIQSPLREGWKEAIAELMEAHNWDFDTALKALKDAEKEEEDKLDKKEERRREIQEILERH